MAASRSSLSLTQRRKLRELEAVRDALREAEDQLGELVQEAQALGIGVVAISESSGLSRQTIYNRRKGATASPSAGPK